MQDFTLFGLLELLSVVCLFLSCLNKGVSMKLFLSVEILFLAEASCVSSGIEGGLSFVVLVSFITFPMIFSSFLISVSGYPCEIGEEISRDWFGWGFLLSGENFDNRPKLGILVGIRFWGVFSACEFSSFTMMSSVLFIILVTFSI